MKLTASILLLYWGIACGTCSAANLAVVKANESAESRIRQFTTEKRIPGLAAAVGVDQSIIWSIGMGYSNLENLTPVSPEKTRFRIGSTSKALTSLGLGKLIDRKAIELDVSVQRYAKMFPKKPEGRVTIRQLAGHLAGIRHYNDASELASQKSYSSVAEAVDYFKDDPLVSRPGERFTYSTYGYTLLSAAMEGAAGKSYLTYMQDEIFTPLGMRSTGPDVPRQIIEGRTGFYYFNGTELVNGPYIDTSNKLAGGGLLSSANDLVRFGLAFFDEKVITARTQKSMWESQSTVRGELTGYGIGWFVGKDAAGRRWVQHPGRTLGGSAVLRIYPDYRMAIALLCNLSMGADEWFEALPDQLFAEFSEANEAPESRQY